jgi:hypothetical protein
LTSLRAELISAAVSWGGTLALTIMEWRSGATSRPRDPPFNPPAMSLDHEDYADDDDAESQYHQIPPARRATADNSDAPSSPFNDRNRYAYNASADGPPVLPRPSMDAYGAFSDPAPSGYGSGGGAGAGEYSAGSPTADRQGVSRTMQYADPYAAVRASIAGGGGSSTPPSYETYQGYR